MTEMNYYVFEPGLSAGVFVWQNSPGPCLHQYTETCAECEKNQDCQFNEKDGDCRCIDD